MDEEINAVIMRRIKDALQPLEHNWSIDKYCQDVTERAVLPAEAAVEAEAVAAAVPADKWAAATPPAEQRPGGNGTLASLAVLCIVLFLGVLVVGMLVPINAAKPESESEDAG